MSETLQAPEHPSSEPTSGGSAHRFRTLRRLRRDRTAVASLLVLVLVVLVAALAPVLAFIDPAEQDLGSVLQGPSAEHLLGTDSLGRDNWSRLLHGARITLVAAVQATAIGLVVGVPLGMVAGFVGGWVGRTLNGVSDAVMSVPALLLAVVVIGVLGPGLTNAMIAVGVILAPRFFRIMRSSGEAVQHETYIEASRAIGCSTWRILWRHLLPNTSGPLLVQTSFSLGLAITAEASLSFLGLGVQDPQASWGSMVQQAFTTVNRSTFGLWPPSIAIAVTILAFSLLGDSVRDALGREVAR